MKIIDKLNEKNSDELTYSIEFFPPKTYQGIENLKDRADRMFTSTNPMFVDLTWGAGGSTSETTLDLSIFWQTKKNYDVNMHLTCTNMPLEKINDTLDQAIKNGITNIVALRGDPPIGEEKWSANQAGFTCALDLVKHIRVKYNDQFCLSVAGYPEGHPDQIEEIPKNKIKQLSPTELARMSERDGKVFVCSDKKYWDDLHYLKQKVDAGADIIITQLFYDIHLFTQFIEDCKSIGINCPILPGIMLIQSYDGFIKMTKFCKTKVPIKLINDLLIVKDDQEAFFNKGVEIVVDMCRDLSKYVNVNHFHFYLLNKEKMANSIINKILTF